GPLSHLPSVHGVAILSLNVFDEESIRADLDRSLSMVLVLRNVYDERQPVSAIVCGHLPATWFRKVDHRKQRHGIVETGVRWRLVDRRRHTAADVVDCDDDVGPLLDSGAVAVADAPPEDLLTASDVTISIQLRPELW